MKLFLRRFHGSSRCFKDVSRFIDNSKTVPKLHSAPTIYNTKSSASNYKGYMKAKIASGVYFHPSQSSSTGSINIETLPASFLPKNDIRKDFIKELNRNDKLKGTHAPPVLASKSAIAGKQYHLSPRDVEEIKKLRNENPEKYTRKTLAKKFGVSPLFVSLVSDASRERKEDMGSRLELIKSKWHEKRFVAREDRKKRKQMWYRA